MMHPGQKSVRKSGTTWSAFGLTRMKVKDYAGDRMR